MVITGTEYFGGSMSKQLCEFDKISLLFYVQGEPGDSGRNGDKGPKGVRGGGVRIVVINDL